MPEESEADVRAISTLMSALKPLDAEARVHVVEFVLRRLGISLGGGAAAQPNRISTSDVRRVHDTTAVPGDVGTVDIRSFAGEKDPKTVNEKVAVIGYYLAHVAPHSERHDYLVSDDIKTFFIQAGFQLPTGPANMTLANAKNAGYLNALDRGQYKLNSVGYNLVAHKLPGGEVRAKKRKTTKKSTKPIFRAESEKMTVPADEWRALYDAFSRFDRHIGQARTININANVLRAEARDVAQQYFRQTRPLLQDLIVEEQLDTLDLGFQRILSSFPSATTLRFHIGGRSQPSESRCPRSPVESN